MKSTEQTLLEQMRISDFEIKQRKELLNFSEKDIDILTKCKPYILEQVDNIVEEFYNKQTSIEEIALLIGDSDTLNRLKLAQKKYIIELFSGFYDIDYVNNRLRIGMVHKRIGVDPKLYLSAVYTLKTILTDKITTNFSQSNNVQDIIQSLGKLLYFDITLVFDTYIRSLVAEIESSKMKAENYALSLEEKVKERTLQLEELSQKDSLTSLYNQRTLREYLRRDLLSAERNNHPVCLVYLDVDKFKAINDKQGHQKGDEILKIIGNALLKVSRKVDTPCRYGGDEFCLVLPNCVLEDAEKICQRLISEVKKCKEKISLSIGLAQTGPDQYDDVDSLIKMADSKMYKAKKVEGYHIEK